MSAGERLDHLERQVLSTILTGDHPLLQGLRAQAETAELQEREITETGFRCHILLPDSAPHLSVKKPFQLLDLCGLFAGMNEPVGFILFVEDGQLRMLEGQILGEDAWPESPELQRLYYVRPRHPGSADLDEVEDRDLAWALGPEAGLEIEPTDITSIEGIPFPMPLPQESAPDEEERGEEMLDRANTVFNPEETQNIDLERELDGIQMDPGDEDGDTLNQAGSEFVPTPRVLPTRRLMYLLAYNVFLATVLTIALVAIIPSATYLPPTSPEAAFEPGFQAVRGVLIATFIIVLIAGATGGALSNLRGIFKHLRREAGFPSGLEAPFYIRPLTGALAGLFTFFAVNLFLEAVTVGTAQLGWATLPGRMTYVALALFAGFLAQEVLEKLQEVARGAFSLGDR